MFRVLSRGCSDYKNVVVVLIITLRAKLSGAVYCYRFCLWRRVFVSVFVGLLPR